MPYNTTAIPPRKEVTGQTQLPLSRVKKIIAQDQDINICSNNAAFVICLAAEMFVQHIAEEALKQAKTERKPRRNIQYKDIASAVHHQDNLEFLEDVVPKTVKFRDIKAQAAATRATLRGERAKNDANGSVQQEPPVANGSSAKKHKSSGSRSSLNGSANIAGMLGGGGGAGGSARQSHDDEAADPNDQLEMESRQARGEADDDDVAMTDLEFIPGPAQRENQPETNLPQVKAEDDNDTPFKAEDYDDVALKAEEGDDGTLVAEDDDVTLKADDDGGVALKAKDVPLKAENDDNVILGGWYPRRKITGRMRGGLCIPKYLKDLTYIPGPSRP